MSKPVTLNRLLSVLERTFEQLPDKRTGKNVTYFDTLHVFRKLGPATQLYVCATGTRPANHASQRQILAEPRLFFA
jgi:hypothetical protein